VGDLTLFIEILEFAEFVLEKWQMRVNYLALKNQVGKVKKW
jgi:predicted HAD superfamily hydrolase